MNRFREILEKLIEIIKKSSLNIKIGVAAGFAILLIAVILTLNVSTSQAQSMLFDRPLTIEEFGLITSEIENMGIDFSTKGEKYIIVADEEVGRNIRMKLAQSGKNA